MLAERDGLCKRCMEGRVGVTCVRGERGVDCEGGEVRGKSPWF